MLILASQSPRRAELLRNAGIAFEVRPAEVDERARANEPPLEYVRRLAKEKALAVLSPNAPTTGAPGSPLAAAPAGAIVLGADTAVVVDSEVLGKPIDAADARRMLSMLSGRTHQVMTGVCLAWRHSDDIECVVEAEVTEVEFAALSEEEIASYVAMGEPMDKAGAYAIQGRASRWIPRIRGCHFNVVGLPVARVCAMLQRAQNGSNCL